MLHAIHLLYLFNDACMYGKYKASRKTSLSKINKMEQSAPLKLTSEHMFIFK